MPGPTYDPLAGHAPVWARLIGGDGVSPASASNPQRTSAAPLTAGTDRSGTAGTTSSTLAAANTSRQGLEVQNVSANNLGINEFGGTAAIGSAGTYTLPAGATMRVKTNRQVNVIASAASSAYTATEY
jgi:hypothetical protein